MERELTDLEKGILVYIDPSQYERLKVRSGFLPVDSYPEFYKNISIHGELGRFMFFRLISM